MAEPEPDDELHIRNLVRLQLRCIRERSRSRLQFMSAQPSPRCPTHGQMSLRFETDTWVCHGWDGEGCDVFMLAEVWEWINEDPRWP